MNPIDSAAKDFRSGVLELFLRLGLIISGTLIPFYYMIGIKPLSVGCALYFAVCIQLWRIYHADKHRLDAVANVFILITFVLILTGQYFNTAELDSSPWLLLFPIVAFPLGRFSRGGIVWVAGAATGYIAIYAMFNPHQTTISTLFILIASYLATAFVVFRFVRYNNHNIRRVAQLSSYDFLTQVFNRRLFYSMSQDEFNRNLRSNSSMTIYMCDIDYFKQYNDTYGHVRGDKILKLVAETLKHTLKRGSDHLFRYGGEEFSILCSGLTQDQAAQLASNLREGIDALNQPHESSSFQKLTISIGYYHADQLHDLTPEELVKHADTALYQAKNQGRNQAVKYS